VKAQARANIDAMAERGRPDCYGAIEAGEAIKWPTAMHRPTSTLLHAVTKDSIARVDGLIDFNFPDVPALISWLFKDQLLAKVEAEIDQCADDANALTDSDRAKKLTATAQEILETERLEERLIELAADQGQDIARRPDADPRAILGVDGPAPRAE